MLPSSDHLHHRNKMASHVVGLLLIFIVHIHGYFASPITALCFRCYCSSSTLTCANQQVDSIVEYLFNEGYAQSYNVVDFSHAEGVDNLSPSMIHQVFPRLTTIYLGKIGVCWSASGYEIIQHCNCEF